jgi:hypothetical protein
MSSSLQQADAGGISRLAEIKVPERRALEKCHQASDPE